MLPPPPRRHSPRHRYQFRRRRIRRHDRIPPTPTRHLPPPPPYRRNASSTPWNATSPPSPTAYRTSITSPIPPSSTSCDASSPDRRASSSRIGTLFPVPIAGRWFPRCISIFPRPTRTTVRMPHRRRIRIDDDDRREREHPDPAPFIAFCSMPSAGSTDWRRRRPCGPAGTRKMSSRRSRCRGGSWWLRRCGCWISWRKPRRWEWGVEVQFTFII
mmetsp:Transcript_24528/g.50452  ORF Transcript_24528/g.50452 Transcript_24528/m.50452 type:complete len:215 (+) Transcript_24528:277-921(+)